jgi:hypothetical protein
MATYCAQADIELVFGTPNVSGNDGWADIEHDQSNISDRIDQAIAVASERIDDVLRLSPYGAGYTNASGTRSVTITDLAARLAGIWLYETKGAYDVDPQSRRPIHRFGFMKRDAERRLREIREGLVRIDAT